jgi:dephospho-CoA kinase
VVQRGKKPVIGILGGICSGKSAVAAEFGRLGCAIIDADKMAKQLLNEPAIERKIISLFGKNILDAAGTIDRQKLAEMVFSDQSLLAELTKVIHPPVLEKTSKLIETYAMDDVFAAIVLDMPLLAEVGWEKRCDKLVFVDSKMERRLERAKNRGLGDENNLKIRENFQISLDKKAQMSDYIVHNNSDLSELALQVSRIFNCIVKEA